mmetsp:Transcript_858/g.1994  ORF Transcript_858/g.1994 Transcript_858/m.1994 type:complete len:113 (+) Transcript_858:1105-1443(+)
MPVSRKQKRCRKRRRMQRRQRKQQRMQQRKPKQREPRLQRFNLDLQEKSNRWGIVHSWQRVARRTIEVVLATSCECACSFAGEAPRKPMLNMSLIACLMCHAGVHGDFPKWT